MLAAPLDESAIAAAVARLGPHRPTVKVLKKVDSTNNWMLQRMGQSKSGISDAGFLVCAAEYQSSGRGRRGKAWHTPETGVTFSLGIRIPLALSQVSGVSLLVGAAVCDCLREVGVAGAMVKWPNDILVRDAKLCGILVEVQSYTEQSTDVVIGIGVNYRRGAEAQQIDQPVVDLFDLCNAQPPLRSSLIGSLAANVYQSIGRMRADSLSTLKTGWTGYDALDRRAVEVRNGNELIAGKAMGIDDSGQLLVETTGGIQSYSSAEVSIRRSGNTR